MKQLALCALLSITSLGYSQSTAERLKALLHGPEVGFNVYFDVNLYAAARAKVIAQEPVTWQRDAKIAYLSYYDATADPEAAGQRTIKALPPEKALSLRGHELIWYCAALGAIDPLKGVADFLKTLPRSKEGDWAYWLVRAENATSDPEAGPPPSAVADDDDEKLGNAFDAWFEKSRALREECRSRAAQLAPKEPTVQLLVLRDFAEGGGLKSETTPNVDLLVQLLLPIPSDPDGALEAYAANVDALAPFTVRFSVGGPETLEPARLAALKSQAAGLRALAGKVTKPFEECQIAFATAATLYEGDIAQARELADSWYERFPKSRDAALAVLGVGSYSEDLSPMASRASTISSAFPEDLQLTVQCAKVFEKLVRLDEAVTLLEKAVRMEDPEETGLVDDAKVALFALRVRRGDDPDEPLLELAKGLAESLDDLSPDQVSAFMYTMVVVSVLEGDVEGAKTRLRRLIDVFPQEKVFKEALAILEVQCSS